MNHEDKSIETVKRIREEAKAQLNQLTPGNKKKQLERYAQRIKRSDIDKVKTF